MNMKKSLLLNGGILDKQFPCRRRNLYSPVFLYLLLNQRVHQFVLQGRIMTQPTEYFKHPGEFNYRGTMDGIAGYRSDV
jgi:hypothetical protein